MRRLTAAAVIAVACTLAACASSGAVPRPFPGAALPPAEQPASGATPPPASVPGTPPLTSPVSTKAVVLTALALRGTPYRNGGSDPGGFDCSGFVQWTFNQHGLRLPRETREQYRIGHRVDLLFFETVSRGASHVGIAIGGGEFVHAPSSRGVVRVERYGSDYWASRFIGARRVDTPSPTTD